MVPAVLSLSPIIFACVKLLRELPALEDCLTVVKLFAFAVLLRPVVSAAGADNVDNAVTDDCCLALLDLRLVVEVVVQGSTCVKSLSTTAGHNRIRVCQTCCTRSNMLDSVLHVVHGNA